MKLPLLDKLPIFDSRPAHTLLFITENQTYRVDADRKGRLSGAMDVIQTGCKKPEKLAQTLERALPATAALGANTWLLFLHLPAFWLSLQATQINGIDEATLQQVLQYESEGLTGWSSQDKAMAYQRLRAGDDMVDFWLVQTDQLVIDDVVKTLKSFNSRLAGLLHPGALPKPLFGDNAGEWLRIENWSNQLLAFHQDGETVNLLLLSYDSPHWRAELDQWLDELGKSLGGLPPSETLTQKPTLDLLPDTDQALHLSENGDVPLWLERWAAVLIADRNHANVPVLQAAPAVNAEVYWMVGSGAAALLLCGLHAGWFLYQSGFFNAETERLKEVETMITDLNKRIAEQNKQSGELEISLKNLSEDADLLPETINKLQQRPALLLRALADGRQDELIIETITDQLDAVTVSGVMLKQDLGNQLAGFLQKTLATAYWDVQSPTKEDMALFEDGAGPWSFSIKLTDTGVPELHEEQVARLALKKP